MSMHKISLTPLEEEGMLLHGLPIGTPSQRSDTFRQGVAWGIGEAKRLTEENERLRKDAERYRFLRDNDKDTGLCIYDYARTVDYGSGGIADIGEVIPSSCADKIIDMAIDAARGAK